nr:hypothetical protein [Helicobacter bizzozeronii]
MRQQEHIAQKHEELKAYQDQQQALKELILKCAPPALPLFKDYIKAYADLKEQFFNATSLEDARAILRQLRQDYAELLEMDRRGIMDVLYVRAGTSALAFLLWLCAGVSLWNRWDILRETILTRGATDDEYISLNHLFGGISFHDFCCFAECKTLTIPKEGKAHVFKKAVCVQERYSIEDREKKYRYFNLTANIGNKNEKYLFRFASPSPDYINFYLLKGAVEIKNREYYFDITLTYIQIEP